MSSKERVGPVKILLVVASRKIERAIRTALKTDGLISRISTYTNVEDARTRIMKSGRFDVILADDEMPGVSGLDFLKDIISTDNPPPMVLLVNSGGEERAAEALESKVDHCLIKDPEDGYLKLLTPLILGAIQRESDRATHEQVETALKDSETRYRSLFDRVPIGLFRTTPSGKVMDANPALVKILGLPDRETALAINARDFYVHPRARKRWENQMSRDGVVRGWEVEVERHDGSYIWVEVASTAFRDQAGKVLYYEGSIRDITAEKKADDAVRESAKRYRSLFDSAGDAIFLMQEDRFIECNDRTLALFGVARQEIINRTPYDFSPPNQPDGRASKEKALEKIDLARQGSVESFEWKHKRLDGSLFDAEVTLTRIDLDEGPIIQAIVKDISQRKEAIEYLRFHLAFEQLVTSISTRFISISSAEIDQEIPRALMEVGEFIGVDRSVVRQYDAEGKLWLLLHEWRVEEVEPIAAEHGAFDSEELGWITSKLLAGEVVQISDRSELPRGANPLRRMMEIYSTQALLIVPMILEGKTNGMLGFHSLQAKPLWSPELINMIKIIGEIIGSALERKRVEAELKESEEKFRSLVEYSLTGILILNDSYELTYVNDELSRISGYSKSELLGLDFRELLDDENRGLLQDRYERRQRGEKIPHRYEFTLTRKDGEKRLCEITSVVIPDPEGRPRTLAQVKDITQRQRAEDALRESEERFQRLANASFEGIAISDKGVVLDASEQLEHILGYERGEMIGMRAVEMVAPDSRDLVQSNIQSGFDEPYEHLAQRKDGSIFPVEVRGRTIPHGGRPVRVTAIRDITDRKQAEKALHDHARRLEALRKIDQAILVSQSPKETAGAALSRISELIPFLFGGIGLFDFEENCVEILETLGDLGQGDAILATDYSIDDFVYSIDSLHKGEITVLQDLMSVKDLKPIFQRLAGRGIHSLFEVPLTLQGELIGVLRIFSEIKDAFNQTHIDIAREVADSLAGSIQQARLLELEQKRRRNLELLEQISIVVRSAESKTTLFGYLLEEMFTLFQAEAAAMLTPENGEFYYSYLRVPEEWKEKLRKKEYSEDEFSSLNPGFLNSDTSPFPFEIKGFQSTLALPLRVDDRISGVMLLYWHLSKEFSEEEKRLFSTITEIAGVAIQRLHIFESLERQVSDRTREITALYELAEISASNQDLPIILSKSLERIVVAVEGSSGTIHLYDSDQTQINLVVHHGFHSETISELAVLSPDNHLWGSVIKTGEAQMRVSLNDDPSTPDAILNTTMANYIGAPIKSLEGIHGVISVFYAPGHNASLDDLGLLNLVADQIGIAVERSQLRVQADRTMIMEERQRLARELHDSVTQSLYSISFLAEASKNFTKTEEWDEANIQLETLQETAQQAIKEMRLLLFELLPASLEDLGLIGYLANRLSSVEQRSGIETEILTEGNFELPTDVSIDIFRIVQEALNNTLKHASATAVIVRLHENERNIEVSIEDNGKGFDVERIDGGMGIRSMRERAEKLGGILTVLSKPGRGTNIQLSIEGKA